MAVEATRPRLAEWKAQKDALVAWAGRAERVNAVITQLHDVVGLLERESNAQVQRVADATNQVAAFRRELDVGETTAHALQPEMVQLARIWDSLYSGHLRRANVQMPGMYFPLPANPRAQELPLPPSPPAVAQLPGIPTVRVSLLMIYCHL